MRVLTATLALFASSILASDLREEESASKRNWPQWRGPNLTGVAPEADPPTKWSETENVKWKVKIPGFGTSTPVIWGDQIFITSAEGTGKKAEAPSVAAQPAEPQPPADSAAPGGRQRRGGGGGGRSEQPSETYKFLLLSYDRKSGKQLWQTTLREEVPHEGHHRDHGFASASAVTDGKRVYAFFGSRGLHALDMGGKKLWSKDFGKMRTKNTFGEGASPALHGNIIVVNWDHEGDDFIVALNATNGEQLWKQSRDEGTTWSTPLIVAANQQTQVVVNATGKVRSYELNSGKLLWESGGQTANAIPTPVAIDDMVIAMSGFRGSMLKAIRRNKTGNLDETDAIVWSHNKSTPYVPSPLLYGDLLYFIAGNNGVISCHNARTGETYIDAARLDAIRGIYASPVGAAGRVYVVGREGTSVVLKNGRTLEVLATNKLDDKIDASPAIVGKDIFLRGHQYLYCIGS